MELEEARETVRALANGIDPTTGEVLPDSSPYNNPRIIRALFRVLDTSTNEKKSKKSIEEKQQENLKAGRPKNAGLPWTDELKAEVASKFRSGVPVEELSTHFERTRGAILSELAKQGLIEPEHMAELR
jgi:hypothetical protein